MNLKDYRIYCNEVMNREELGEPASPEEFNTYIKLAVNEYYKEQYQAFLQGWAKAPDGISLPYYISSIAPFLKRKVLTNGSIRTVDLPFDYKYPVSVTLVIDGVHVNAKILSPDQTDNALYNDLASITEYPVALIDDDGLEGVPNDYTEAILRYFRTIDEPNFDYCVSDNTGRVIYMPVGSELFNDAGTITLKDSQDNVLATDVSHVDSPSLPYASQSVEIEFDDAYFTEIAGKVIEVMAAKNREAGMINYSKSEQYQSGQS